MTTSRALSIALQDTDTPPLRPLPAKAAGLLHDVDAPPRLVAHLRAVHDVAGQLLDWLASRDLDLGIDPEAVLFGAAIHDKRVPELEGLVVAKLAAASGRQVWEEFLDLDSVLADIGDHADERLAFQMSHPTT